MTGPCYGIIGHRSWIGRALTERLLRIHGATVYNIPKDSSGMRVSGLDCLYIIPGRVEQTGPEMDEEREMVFRVAADPMTCRRQVLLGSRAPLDTTYGQHKALVERSFLDGADKRRTARGEAGMRSLVVRPGAVFGPTQDIDSKMLVPSLAREGSSLSLSHPDRPTDFISVCDLVDCMAVLAHESGPTSPEHIRLLEFKCHHRAHWNEDVHIPGTFTMTPRQMLSLWQTWNRYHRRCP